MTAAGSAEPEIDEDGTTALADLAEVALPAVRAIVGVAVRSLEASPVAVTLAQYRVLLALHDRGPQRAAALAAQLGVGPSTVTRMGDRLVRDGLVVRRAERGDRRAVRIALSPAGVEVVRLVRVRRRQEFATLLQAVPPSRRAAVVDGLRELGDASTAAAFAVPAAVLGWIG